MTATPDPAPDRDALPASSVDAALADVLARAGAALSEVPADTAAEHLQAIRVLAAEHAHRVPAPRPSGWTTRLRRLFGLTVVKVAFGAGIAAAGTTGGLAAGGHLPAPVQQAVSDGVGWFGVDVPAPDLDEATPTVEDDAPLPQDVVAPESDEPPPAGAEGGAGAQDGPGASELAPASPSPGSPSPRSSSKASPSATGPGNRHGAEADAPGQSTAPGQDANPNPSPGSPPAGTPGRPSPPPGHA